MSRFIHLKNHSAYSLLEGALPLKKLIKLAVSDNQPALGLTDTNNLFGALEFSEYAAAEGLQPIIGINLGLAVDGLKMVGRKALRYPHLTLFAKNERGYENLMALASFAYLDVEPGTPAHITLDKLIEFSSDLICLSGGTEGVIAELLMQGQKQATERLIDSLKEVFGDRFYIELQRHGLAREQELEPQLLSYAYDKEIPIVASNENFFAEEGDYEAHDALICIADGAYTSEDDRRQLAADYRFKTQKEMIALFADLPEAIENTVEIAKRTAYRPLKRAPILPRFTGDEGDEAAEANELRRQAREGLEERFARNGLAPGYDKETYYQRLDFELDIIISMKFPGYFLIVADFIKWSKANDIPVGPGRGSGAGSLVAYALTITDLDPLRFGLLFERFLNPERVSMPDFDIDFCQDGREQVIRYVQQKYGNAQVAQIITFGSLQARAVLRDVGRVLQMSYGQVDRLSKMVPAIPGKPVTLKEVVETEPRFREAMEAEEIVQDLVDKAQRLEGLYRHASTHAAGIVIGDRPLHELVPLYRDPKSDMQVTQFNMKWVESAGLVKFDFLGLKTLTVLAECLRLLKERGIEIDLSTIPLDDAKSFEMMARGETVGVFQVESAGMRDALRQMKPDRLEDIIALVALYRPGPMDNIPTYCQRKQGLEEPDYLHPKLQPVLEETYGVIIYQEQVMQIAQILSGYSLGEADLLRRAMGKKIQAEMDQQRVRFVDGAVERGVKKEQAQYIFDLVNKFAGYGFNKSHAAAYALISYQTAYFKANYPLEFLAASMTLDMDRTDKLNDFSQDIRRLGYEVHPPCINASDAIFRPENGNSIRYALAAIKGFGRSAAEFIVAERRENGPYKNLGDFANRISPRFINKKALECLIAAGALDSLDKNRAKLLAGMEYILATAARAQESLSSGQDDMFGSGGGGSEKGEALELRHVAEWLPEERLAQEFRTIGFFLSGHPLDSYGATLEAMQVKPYSDFARAVEKGATAGILAGIVASKSERRTKKGKPFAIVGFSDRTAQFEGFMFSETLEKARPFLEAGQPLLISVRAEYRDEEVKLTIEHVESLVEAAKKVSGGLRVRLKSDKPISFLQHHLKPNRSGKRSRISLFLALEDGSEVEIDLKDNYEISPSVATALEEVEGVVKVEMLGV